MMRAVLRAAGVAALLAGAACAAVVSNAPFGNGGDRPVRVQSRPVTLGIAGATLAPGVTFAGGVSLRGEAFHGLSDLKIEGDRAWSVSDFGALVRFSLVHDRAGRLISVGDALARPLTGLDGAVLADKDAGDAEGLALSSDGRLLISFEQDHRVWSYPRQAGADPMAMASPNVDLAPNAGFEGLAAAGRGWLVLGEEGGGWLCERVCTPLGPLLVEDDYRFTGADVDPQGRGWFVVERSFRPPLDVRARVRRLSPDGRLSAALIDLRHPATVDNFEGIAAVATPTGTRLYLLSDDNARPLQRTLLLAFDLTEPSS